MATPLCPALPSPELTGPVLALCPLWLLWLCPRWALMSGLSSEKQLRWGTWAGQRCLSAPLTTGHGAADTHLPLPGLPPCSARVPSRSTLLSPGLTGQSPQGAFVGRAHQQPACLLTAPQLPTGTRSPVSVRRREGCHLPPARRCRQPFFSLCSGQVQLRMWRGRNPRGLRISLCLCLSWCQLGCV